MNDTYIIITPCKNEANSLHDLFKSVIDQTIKPSLWVIVNDGSQDDSRSIILKYCDKYSWIKMVDLPERPRDSFYRYSEVCKVGFDYVVKFAKKENIDFQFIGLIDADLIIEIKSAYSGSHLSFLIILSLLAIKIAGSPLLLS